MANFLRPSKAVFFLFGCLGKSLGKFSSKCGSWCSRFRHGCLDMGRGEPKLKL